MFDIKLNESNLRDIDYNLESLQKKLPQITANSINRSLEMVRTEQTRKTVDMYHIKKGKLMETISLKPATVGSLTGLLRSRGGMIGFDHFKLTPKTRQGGRKLVNVAIKKDGIKPLPNAFIAYRDGRLGAFERVGEKRLPIKRLMGPSAPQMLGEMSILDYLQGFAEDKFNMRFAHEIERMLK